jgi:arylsulfatase A-like enzyme
MVRLLRVGASVRAAFRATLAALVAFGFAGRTTPDRFDPGRIVILVVVDTLRADHVGIHGLARRDATPNLDRFARRGAWFLNAHSAAPWTPPSVQSLLTSLDPAVHGLNREGSAYAESIPRLSGRARPLAQLLAESGFRTNAITGGGGVDSRYGFDRGFESWFQPESVTGIDVESGVDKALAWLGRLAPGERAFLLLHTYEVHLPNTHHLFATEETGDDRSRASAAYDGDVAFADRELGRFFRELERTSLLPRSLVVVTADHGENLFDRVLGGRGVEHGHHLHDELTHVPLILVAPGLVPARGPIPGLVSLLDVMPTILSLVGVAPPGYPMQGRDLRPALQLLQPLDSGRALFAGAPLQGPLWRSVRTGTAKYVRLRSRAPSGGTPSSRPPEAVYDLGKDPEERWNVAATSAVARDRLKALLRNREREEARLRDQMGPVGASPGISTLRSLGYLR